MSPGQRLDAELVRRGLARSREHAVTLLRSGQVRLPGRSRLKPATPVTPEDLIEVTGATTEYVSRGGHKLAGALDVFSTYGLDVLGRAALDVGASTGGFTDALLRRGATRVLCVDVGTDQLAPALRSDPRVTVLDQTNARDLDASLLPVVPDLVVADLSFISLVLVLPALRRCVVPDADFVLLVKPQFEVGRAVLGAGGVVRDPEQRADAVRGVARAAYEEHGLGVRAVTASLLPGPSGNVEYFVWLRADAAALDDNALMRAIEEGPR